MPDNERRPVDEDRSVVDELRHEIQTGSDGGDAEVEGIETCTSCSLQCQMRTGLSSPFLRLTTFLRQVKVWN